MKSHAAAAVLAVAAVATLTAGSHLWSVGEPACCTRNASATMLVLVHVDLNCNATGNHSADAGNCVQDAGPYFASVSLSNITVTLSVTGTPPITTVMAAAHNCSVDVVFAGVSSGPPMQNPYATVTVTCDGYTGSTVRQGEGTHHTNIGITLSLFGKCIKDASASFQVADKCSCGATYAANGGVNDTLTNLHNCTRALRYSNDP